MAFNSFEYVFFFLAIAFLYYIIPFRFRWAMVLAASYYFYISWQPVYVTILIAQTVVAYGAALMIGKFTEPRRRIACMMAGLSINIGMLFVYKYLKFFTITANSILEYLHLSTPLPVYDLILPLGISFFTFQTTAYIVDVYRETLPPEKHFGLFALFIALFPHLMAGPITRGSHILPQLKKEIPLIRNRITGGIKLILMGLFKKVVIADRLAPLVDTVYNNPHNYEGIPLIVAAVFFAFQLYCDFSGYVDIAIGSAQILGVDFPDNFNHPYLASSIGDLWRRWHMTLMSWFNDYIYFPLARLGDNGPSMLRIYFITFLIFLISGLWHGANWTYIAWGALNAFYMIIEIITKSSRKRITRHFELNTVPALSRLYTVLCIAVTFSLTCFAFIFFRANSVSDALYITTHLFSGIKDYQYDNLYGLGLNRGDFYFGICAVVLLEVFEWTHKRENMRFMLSDKPRWLRWSMSCILLLTVLLFGYHGNKPFIYFAF